MNEKVCVEKKVLIVLVVFVSLFSIVYFFPHISSTSKISIPSKASEVEPTYVSDYYKHDVCDMSSQKSVSSAIWKNLCCNQHDVQDGRFKCVIVNSDNKIISYQFHCSANRYWQCKDGCVEYKKNKKDFFSKAVMGPICKTLLENTMVQIPPPTSTITPTPKPIPTITPTPTIPQYFFYLKEYQKFLDDNLIKNDFRVLMKQKNNDILSSELQNKLHEMLSKYLAHPNEINNIFKVKNSDITYTNNEKTVNYIYFFKDCTFQQCFNPNDTRCDCNQGSNLEIRVHKDKFFNNKALFEWSINGYKIPPSEYRYPWVFGVDQTDNVYTMFTDRYSSSDSLINEEKTKLGNNKIFINYLTRAGYLIIEIYRENNNVILRGIDLRGL